MIFTFPMGNLMRSGSDKTPNPYLNDPDVRKAINILVRFMVEKINPEFSGKAAWLWCLENKASIDAEMATEEE